MNNTNQEQEPITEMTILDRVRSCETMGDDVNISVGQQALRVQAGKCYSAL